MINDRLYWINIKIKTDIPSAECGEVRPPTTGNFCCSNAQSATNSATTFVTQRAEAKPPHYCFLGKCMVK